MGRKFSRRISPPRQVEVKHVNMSDLFCPSTHGPWTCPGPEEEPSLLALSYVQIMYTFFVVMFSVMCSVTKYSGVRSVLSDTMKWGKWSL